MTGPVLSPPPTVQWRMSAALPGVIRIDRVSDVYELLLDLLNWSRDVFVIVSKFRVLKSKSCIATSSVTISMTFSSDYACIT